MWGLWNATVLGAAWLLLSSGGCTSMMRASKVPEVRTLSVTDTPDVAYAKAKRVAVARMGMVLQTADPAEHLFQGVLKNAVLMTVEVLPNGAGSLVKASATVMGNKIAFGSLTEHEEFINLLRQSEYGTVAR